MIIDDLAEINRQLKQLEAKTTTKEIRVDYNSLHNCFNISPTTANRRAINGHNKILHRKDILFIYQEYLDKKEVKEVIESVVAELYEDTREIIAEVSLKGVIREEGAIGLVYVEDKSIVKQYLFKNTKEGLVFNQINEFDFDEDIHTLTIEPLQDDLTIWTKPSIIVSYTSSDCKVKKATEGTLGINEIKQEEDTKK